MFVNTVTTNGKYFVFNRVNLTQPIQMQLSKKQKDPSHFFAFLEYALNFEHFQKKHDPHS